MADKVHRLRVKRVTQSQHVNDPKRGDRFRLACGAEVEFDGFGEFGHHGGSRRSFTTRRDGSLAQYRHVRGPGPLRCSREEWLRKLASASFMSSAQGRHLAVVDRETSRRYGVLGFTRDPERRTEEFRWPWGTSLYHEDPEPSGHHLIELETSSGFECHLLAAWWDKHAPAVALAWAGLVLGASLEQADANAVMRAARDEGPKLVLVGHGDRPTDPDHPTEEATCPRPRPSP